MPKTADELEIEISALRGRLSETEDELRGAKTRIQELNGESGAHRGNYNREKKARFHANRRGNQGSAL